MIRHLGYACLSLASSHRTNQTCRLENATPERLRQLTRENLKGLREILAFNLLRDIHLYRICSGIIPFASHEVNTTSWWTDYEETLTELGRFVKEHGMRVSTHPGQYTVLSARTENIRAASEAELIYHARLLDQMGLDASHKIVIHIGGAYSDKEDALRRAIGTVRQLPSPVIRRLVVEHDEHSFSVDDILRVSTATGLPAIFDWLHFQINPGSYGSARQAILDCAQTWRPEDGLPKVHFSSQQEGARLGTHAEWIDADEFWRFWEMTDNLTLDCMLENKRKDLALLRLREELWQKQATWPQAPEARTG